MYLPDSLLLLCFWTCFSISLEHLLSYSLTHKLIHLIIRYIFIKVPIIWTRKMVMKYLKKHLLFLLSHTSRGNSLCDAFLILSLNQLGVPPSVYSTILAFIKFNFNDCLPYFSLARLWAYWKKDCLISCCKF